MAKEVPGLVKDGKLTAVEDKKIYEILSYQAISTSKLADLEKALPPAKAVEVEAELKDISGRSRQGALADMIVFSICMLAGYLLLIGYFKARGGYKAEVLVGHKAVDAKFTGGVPGAIEA